MREGVREGKRSRVPPGFLPRKLINLNTWDTNKADLFVGNLVHVVPKLYALI